MLGVVAAITLLKTVELRDRNEFCRRLAKIEDGMSREEVKVILGPPDDIVHRTPEEVARFGFEEEWGYGTNGYGTLPTLGMIAFRMGSAVRPWRANPGVPTGVISESELRKHLRNIAPNNHWARSSEIDPLWLIRATNDLHAIGKDAALVVLAQSFYVNPQSDCEDDRFGIICALFNAPHGLRLPCRPLTDDQPPAWADRFPYAVESGVPFRIATSRYCVRTVAPLLTDATDEVRNCASIRPDRLCPIDDPFIAAERLLKKVANQKLPRGIYAVIDRKHALSQVLNLVRTCYVSNDESPDFARCHREFLLLGGHWDVGRQIYVRGDGSHLPLTVPKED